LPPALRSRCLEVFFKPLAKTSLQVIIKNAAKKIDAHLTQEALEEISRYSTNGRESVNMVQLAAGIAMVEKSPIIDLRIVQKVVNNGRFSPRSEVKIKDEPLVGVVNGLAVFGANVGTLLEIEASVTKAEVGQGVWMVTGIAEEEQIRGGERTIRRKSMAKGAFENVMTVLRNNFGIIGKDFDIHINFPGGIPVDGPSAGISMATVVYSAIHQKKIDNLVAMTGEISVHGKVKPVGGIISKIEAARGGGIKTVLIPQENWLSIFDGLSDINIVPVSELQQVLDLAVLKE